MSRSRPRSEPRIIAVPRCCWLQTEASTQPSARICCARRRLVTLRWWRCCGAAAEEALAQGDSHGATALLRRALEEPPPGSERAAVLAALGQAEALAREPAAAEHLSEALSLTVEPEERTAVACALGDLLVWSSGRSVQAYEILTRTLEELGPEAAPPLRAAIETLRLATASVDVRLVGHVTPHLAQIHELADAAGNAGRGLKIFEACWAAQGGPDAEDWRARLDQGLDDGRFVAEHTGGSPIVVYAAIVLVLADEVERAERLLADVRADARARGSILSHLVDLAWGALMWTRRGELNRAVGDAQVALTLARRIDAGWAQIWLVACLADALREQGEIEQAARLVDSVSLEAAMGTSAALHALMARGRVRLAEGDRGTGDRGSAPRRGERDRQQPELCAMALDARDGARAHRPAPGARAGRC